MRILKACRLVFLVGLLCAAGAAAAARAAEVRLVYLGPQGESVWRGVQQGLAEANTLGGFTGHEFRVEPLSRLNLGQMRENPPAALLVAAREQVLRQISSSLEPAGVPIFNLTLEGDALRRDCLPDVFHVPPSEAMKRDALEQWRRQGGADNAAAQAWHSSFVKFAARDLNNRFREAHGISMDDAAWAGWAAVKMVAEAVVRGGSAAPGDVLRYLREETEFDGQKGAALTFRETGQLRQPLLIVEDGEIAAEAPVRGAAGPDDLDSLGITSCQR